MQEREPEKKGKNEILMSEIGYKMFISEQTQKLVTPHCIISLLYRQIVRFFLLSSPADITELKYKQK